jgi:hypothetical protein
VPFPFASKLSSSFCFIAESPPGGWSAGFSGGWANAGQATRPAPTRVIQRNRMDMILPPENRGHRPQSWRVCAMCFVVVCKKQRTLLRSRLEHSAAVGDMSLYQLSTRRFGRGFGEIQLAARNSHFFSRFAVAQVGPARLNCASQSISDRRPHFTLSNPQNGQSR